MALFAKTPVTRGAVAAMPPSVRAPLVHPLHPLNASFASFRDVWFSSDPEIRPRLLELWRQNGHHLNGKKLTRAMDQILGRVKKSEDRINQVNPELLKNMTAAEVFDELCGIDAILEFAVKPAKKSFWDKVPPIVSLIANDFPSGFISPYASFAVAALSASLSYFLPGLFVDTFPKLAPNFDTNWFLMMSGFTILFTYWISGWKHVFGEIFPKTYHLKTKYLSPLGKFKKYAGLQLNEGSVGVDMNAQIDFPQPLRLFNPIKKHFCSLPFFGKFALTLPDKVGELVPFMGSNALNVTGSFLFLYTLFITQHHSSFNFLQALMPSIILTLFNSVGVSYIVKVVKENGESESKIVALRQALGIALFVFSAMTSTSFNNQLAMHPALMVASQFLAGTVMLAGVGTFIKPKKS